MNPPDGIIGLLNVIGVLLLINIALAVYIAHLLTVRDTLLRRIQSTKETP